jgi:hypothetical protein
MDQRFEAIIEAAVQHAGAEGNLLWAEDVARRIASSTPLRVSAEEITEQLTAAAARAGVAVTVGSNRERACPECGIAA